MSDFATLDIMVPKKIHKEFYETYAKDQKNKSTKSVPFERMLDLWFLGFCIAIKKDLNPVETSGQKVKAVQGVVFANNKDQEMIIKQIMIQREGLDILLNPSKMHKIANDLSTAGIAEIKLMLEDDADETELDNVLNCLKDILK